MASPCGKLTRLLGVFVGDELGKAMGDELPSGNVLRSVTNRRARKHGPANKGVLVLFGVLRPRALLAITPLRGELCGILALWGREGVSAGEPKKRGSNAGASGMDC